ncbi:MAG: hypothetical protein V1855_05335, partial [bacterium]
MGLFYLFFVFIFFQVALFQSFVVAFSIDQLKTERLGQLSSDKVVRMLKTGGVRKFFAPRKKTPFEYERVVTDPLYLQRVAQDTLDYIDRFEYTHKHVLEPVTFNSSILPLSKVRETLQFIVDVIENDKKRGKFRILDPKFISRNFASIKWLGDYEHAKRNNDIFAQDGKVRLTHYAVFQIVGRYEKTKKYCKPLYCLPHEDEEAGGALASTPLVWLTEKGYQDALMQGTVFVEMPDGVVRAFRLHLTQNMNDYKEMKKDDRRYYFCEIKGKYFERMYTRCIQRKGIVLAGDIYNVGIGKIIAFSYRNRKTNRLEMRLGVLADTGGAFVKTVYKMDYFAGIFKNRENLRKHM